jgi:hypothetical protein
LARLVRGKDLFDLSMAAAIYALRVPSPYAAACGSRRLNPRGGVVVSHIRMALPECEPDFPTSCGGTSGKRRPIRKGICDIRLKLTQIRSLRPSQIMDCLG